MTFEIKIDTVRPGAQPAHVQRLGEQVARLKGVMPARLEGAWTTEFGRLNSVVHLWSYPDAATAAELEAELSANTTTPDVVDRTSWMLSDLDGRGLAQAAGDRNHIYELRVYRTVAGAADTWAEHFRKILPWREKKSSVLGVWKAASGALDHVLHLWVYDDLAHRAATRAEVVTCPEWQHFLSLVFPLLIDQESLALVPTKFSPLS